MAAGGATTYLVESYHPGLDRVGAATIDGRLRAVVDGLRAEGVDVIWSGSLAILAEETYSYLLTCTDVTSVSTVSSRTGLSAGHVVEVLLAPLSLGPTALRA